MAAWIRTSIIIYYLRIHLLKCFILTHYFNYFIVYYFHASIVMIINFNCKIKHNRHFQCKLKNIYIIYIYVYTYISKTRHLFLISIYTEGLNLDANMLSNISKTGYNNSKVCPVKREFRLDRENYSIKTLWTFHHYDLNERKRKVYQEKLTRQRSSRCRNKVNFDNFRDMQSMLHTSFVKRLEIKYKLQRSCQFHLWWWGCIFLSQYWSLWLCWFFLLWSSS